MLTELHAGDARLGLVPELGGGIAYLDVAGRQVLRPWNGTPDPFHLACIPLLPFSNRLSGAGFLWQGVYHAVERNLATESCPIHGDAFQKPWKIDVDQHCAVMSLAEGAMGPWRYRAYQKFVLSEQGLYITLSLTNLAETTLPYGLGLHPWFPRDHATRLQFHADGVWSENDDYLPEEHFEITETPEWDFRHQRPLPAGWINNAFTDWPGLTEIVQGASAQSCTLKATAPLRTAIVYSPSAEADFFCFEPVSHSVDALNRAEISAMTILQPGESIKTDLNILW